MNQHFAFKFHLQKQATNKQFYLSHEPKIASHCNFPFSPLTTKQSTHLQLIYKNIKKKTYMLLFCPHRSWLYHQDHLIPHFRKKIGATKIDNLTVEVSHSAQPFCSD